MLLLNPFIVAPAGAATTPSIGTITALSQDDATSQSTYQFSTHNSSTGNVLVIFSVRSNSGASPSVTSVKWNNTALTQIEFAKINGVNRAVIYAGLIRNGSTGSRNIDVVLSAAQARDFAGYAIDLDDLAADAIGAHKSVVTNRNQFSQRLTINGILNADSLLIAAFFAHDGTVDPLWQSAGWDDEGEVQSGTGAVNIAGQLTSRVAGAGDTVTVECATDAANLTPSTTVMRADIIAEAVCVNVHLELTGTIYDTGWSTIIRPRLLELGTRHIRGGRGGKSRVRYQDLASAAGIDVLLTNSKTVDDYAPATSYMASNLDHVGAVEMLDEPDINDDDPTDNWKDVLSSRSITFYNDVRAIASLQNIPILHSPLRLASNLDWLITDFADIGDYCDVRSMHDFTNDAAGNAIPETTTADEGGGWSDGTEYYTLTQLDTLYGGLVGSTKPVWSTAIGPRYDADASYSEHQAAKAVVRHLLMRVLQWGYSRLYFYQLIENSSSEEYGLLNKADGTPKQAFNALRNIVSLFKDVGDPHNTYDLSYSTSGTTSDMEEFIVQKRDGRWYYIIWRGLGDGNREFLPSESPRQSVTLNVTGITEARRYEPTLAADMTAALKQTYANPTAITFTVPDHPVVIELTGAITTGSTDDWAAVGIEFLPS